jgi:hypothetical protein
MKASFSKESHAKRGRYFLSVASAKSNLFGLGKGIGRNGLQNLITTVGRKRD